MNKGENEAKESSKPCRVAVSCKGDSIDSEVASIGQSTYFIVFEGSPERFKVFKNEAKGLGSESGIKAADLLRTRGINIVITGTLGQRGFDAFDRAGIMVHAGCSGKVRDSVHKCLKGELPKCKGATYSGYIGF